MKTSRLLMLAACILCTFSLSAQLDFKLQLMPNGTRWGVYVKPKPGTNPSTSTITATGQVTLVAPLGFTVVDLVPVSGNWIDNAVSSSPVENPTKAYISFGYQPSSAPEINYAANPETLLFTFKKASNFCPDEFYLIDNETDPFAQLPNSASTNPGNDLVVLDLGVTPPTTYNYVENYALFAWDCHDCDGDGIPNALEDTNGNGVYDPTIDVSDLCNGSVSCLEITGASLHCAGGGSACGNNPSGNTISLAIDITGGQAPYAVEYTDGTNVFSLQNYQSGAAFQVPVVNGASYSLVKITESEGCIANPADLTGVVPVSLAGAALFTTQPADAAICNTAVASFEACATATNATLDIRWEFSSNQGTTWQAVNTGSGVYSVNNSSTGCKILYVNNVNGLNGYLFRAVAEGTNIIPAISQTAKLTVLGPLSVASDPQNIKVCAGEPVVFNANIINSGGGDIEYTWELSHNNGATWWDGMPGPGITGINSSELTIQNITGHENGDIYRLRARVGNCAVIHTQTALLTVEGPLEVVTQPTDVTVCAGEPVVFTAAFDNFGAGNIEYTWQLSHNNGATWSDATPNAGISGINSNELHIQNTFNYMNGNSYRLQAKVGDCDYVYTQAASLSVEGTPEILSVISPMTVCRGEEACFEVQATLSGGGQLNYQWQERAAGSTTWADVQGATASIFCLSNSEGHNGYCYRALVRTASCAAVTSVEACLVVGDKAVFTEQPQSTNLCPGETATLTASAGIDANYAGQVDYSWQASADGGQSWQDLSNDSNFSGTDGNALTISDLASLGNLQYRLSATSSICGASYSNGATVTVEGTVEISEHPVATTLCAGSSASFSAAVNLLGTGNLYLQWQSSANGIDWANLAEGANYAGTQTSTLTVQNATANLMFRLSASTGVCETTYTEPAMLAVEAPIVFSLQPETAVVCPDETATFSSAVGGGSTALSLQWQSSTNGQTWTDIAASSVFTGVNSGTLNIADVSGLDGVQFRLAAASQNCNANSASAVLVLEAESICNPIPTNYDCISLAVKKLDGGIGWSVWAKADSSFTETSYQLPTAGRVTLVAPIGFAIQGLTSHNGGKWKPGKVTFNPAQDPGKVYFEFNLTPNQNFLQLGPGVERLLFTFSVVNGCPNSLSLMEGIVPPGHFPNQFAGFGAGLSAENIPFHFCGVYGQETWECPPSTSNLMAPTGGNNSVTTGQQVEVGNFFEVAPNPVREELKVTFDENILDKMPSLRLLNLQGQVVYQTVVDGETTRRLDVSGMTPGIYFLALVVDGKLVQREKIIVQ